MSSPFEVNITAGSDKASCSIYVTGKEKHIITDAERTTFNLSDSQLKDAVDAYFGKRPDDAYLHSPTPWGDLYVTYGWPEVYTTLVSTSAEVLEVTTEPTQVKQQTFINNSSQTGTFDVSISDTVTNTTTSEWSTGGTFTVGQSINYSVGFLGTGGGGETSMEYSQSWGIGGSESTEVTLGSTSGVTVELEPGESVIATLYASKGVMKVRVKYNGTLDGSTAVNYSDTYEGHHFWSLGINGVMSADNIPTSVPSQEDMTIDYYSDGVVELSDPKTKKVRSRIPIGARGRCRK